MRQQILVRGAQVSRSHPFRVFDKSHMTRFGSDGLDQLTQVRSGVSRRAKRSPTVFLGLVYLVLELSLKIVKVKPIKISEAPFLVRIYLPFPFRERIRPPLRTRFRKGNSTFRRLSVKS